MNVKRIELYRNIDGDAAGALAGAAEAGRVVIETDAGRIFMWIDADSIQIHGEGRMTINPDASNSVHIRFDR